MSLCVLHDASAGKGKSMTAFCILQHYLLRARMKLRMDERGVVANSALVLVLVCLAIVALVLYLVTSFHVSKK